MLLAPRTVVPQTLEGQTSGSGNGQATSSNVGPAMINSTNDMITGGNFISSQSSHANVTINIGGMSRTTSSGAQIHINDQRSAQNETPSPNPNPNHTSNRRRRRPNRREANIRPVQRSNEMYERLLTLKGRGVPLWIPQPNIRLPIPYRAKGVCIGDVGIVTPFGDFDFLFNICRTRDDPINPEELPDKFAPIYPPLNPTDVREFRGFGPGSYLASSSIVKSQTGDQPPGLTFESYASEGAILTMPDGAFQEELSNLSKFRAYVAVHAANWYKFVNGPRGREAENGDVLVVVGCDKTTSWGMATFVNTSNTSSAQQSNFRLTFRPLQSQLNAGTAYAWEHSGVAEVRVGPEPGENEELEENLTSQLRNQCLFIRSLSVTLQDSVWAETFPGTASATNQEGSQPECRSQGLRPPNPNTSSSSSNSARSTQGRRRSPSGIAEEDKDHEEGSTMICDLPWSSAPAMGSTPSSGDHVGSAGSSDTHDSDDIRPEKPFVDKLYHMTSNLILAKCITWTNNGKSFIVNLQMFPECLGLFLRHDNFLNFVRELNTYGFQVITRISPLNQDQTWEFSHPKFIRGRPDLLHEIRLNGLEHRWNPAMNELPGDLVQSPAQLDAWQNEITRSWINPSKIINEYLLHQVPDAKVALAHDRDWSAMAGLSPSELIKEITLVNEITVDSVSGVVFLEPKNEISLLTIEELSIFKQIQGGKITLEQSLFGSSENRSMLLHNLIDQLRSDYMHFCDQFTMPAKEIPHFLKGHPKRLLSLDDLVDIHLANFQSLLEHHYIHRLRSKINALPPDDPDKGTWLLRLADALSRRFWQLDLKDDLEEAIWYYEEALTLLPQTHYHFLEATLGVCSCVYQRFRLLCLLDDLVKLLDYLHTEKNLNVESLLTPVKVQLQSLPTHKISHSKEKPHGHPSQPSSSSFYLQKPTGSTTSTIHPKRSFTTDAVVPKQLYTDQQPDADTTSCGIGLHSGAYPFTELPPRIFALIIGINTYESPHISNLVGAVPDADAMRDYLQEHLGVRSTRIRNLRDSEATRAAIIDGIKAFSLNDEIKKGDPILIYYAGHGGSADTPKGWEIGGTGKIELLVPYDHSSPLEDDSPKHGIRDRSLEAPLSQLAIEKGNNITVILDCCHSGSASGADATLKIRYESPTFASLNEDIIRHIASYLPEETLKKLNATHRVFFDEWRKTRYGSLTLAENDKQLLDHLSDPDLAKYVKKVVIRPWFITLPRVTPNFWTNIHDILDPEHTKKEIEQRLQKSLWEDFALVVSAMNAMENIKEYFIEWNEENNYHPEFYKACFTPISQKWIGQLTKLTIKVPPPLVKSLALVRLRNLETLEYHFCTGQMSPRDIDDVHDGFLVFVNNLKDSLEYISFISTHSSLNLDISRVYKLLGPFPKLRSISLSAPFDGAHLSDPLAFVGFLEKHRSTLKDISVLTSRCMVHNSPGSLGGFNWIQKILISVKDPFPRLRSLALAMRPLRAPLINVSDFLGKHKSTLNSLFLADRELDYFEFNRLLNFASGPLDLRHLRIKLTEFSTKILLYLASNMPGLISLDIECSSITNYPANGDFETFSNAIIKNKELLVNWKLQRMAIGPEAQDWVRYIEHALVECMPNLRIANSFYAS